MALTVSPIRSSDFIHHVSKSIYPFTNLTPYSPPTHPLATTVIFYEFDFYMGYHAITVWLKSFSTMPSRSIHIVPNDIFPFLGMNNIPLYICMNTHFLYPFIHP